MKRVLWIPVIFVIASYGLYTLSQRMPEASSKNQNATVSLKFPTNFEELTGVANFLHQYKKDHLVYVCVLFCCAYIYKQTFAIPGSVFMNILGGALFGTMVGFPLVCLLTATGATFCYLLSKYFGKESVVQYFPEKIERIQRRVEENMDSLFFFLLFLRLFPMSPNWFMNIVAPLLNIPLIMFFFSVFIGLMPYNFICIQTGCMLSEVKNLDDLFTITTAFKLLLIASIALLPGLLINKIKSKKLKTT